MKITKKLLNKLILSNKFILIKLAYKLVKLAYKLIKGLVKHMLVSSLEI